MSEEKNFNLSILLENINLLILVGYNIMKNYIWRVKIKNKKFKKLEYLRCIFL